jgi:hypothetical protein
MANYGLMYQTGGIMVVRGPKELLLELISINGEIEKVHNLADFWATSDMSREDILLALIRRKLQSED